jgi:hypothetical protein
MPEKTETDLANAGLTDARRLYQRAKLIRGCSGRGGTITTP